MTTRKPLLHVPRLLLLLCAGVIFLLPMTVQANEFPPDWTPPETLTVSANEDVFADVAPWCPSTGAVCRVNRNWTVEEIQQQLGPKQTTAWRDGDTLNFAYKGRVDDVFLSGSISTMLVPVGNSDYWVVSLQIKELHRAVLTYAIYEVRGNLGTYVRDSAGIWRGPRSPEPPEIAVPLDGHVVTNYIYSPALDEMRLVTTYLPPNYARNKAYPVIYMPTGQAVDWFAMAAEPLIKKGAIPPLLIIGAHSAPFESTRARPLEEYILGLNPEAYEAHEQFFTEELRRWAELGWGASAEPADRVLFGFSNGAVFAGNTGVRKPDLYGHIVAFSAPQRPQVTARSRIEADYYLLAGTLETVIYPETQRAHFTLLLLGVNSSFTQRVGGHDSLMWQAEFPNVLRWWFDKD